MNGVVHRKATMNKLLLMAIRSLPEEWIREDTEVAECTPNEGVGNCIVAACPLFPPLVYREAEHKWEPLAPWVDNAPHGIYPKEPIV